MIIQCIINTLSCQCFAQALEQKIFAPLKIFMWNALKLFNFIHIKGMGCCLVGLGVFRFAFRITYHNFAGVE